MPKSKTGQPRQAESLNRGLSPEQRRENARRAGKASGVARRKQKALRECLQMLLRMDMSEEDRQAAALAGIPDKEMSNAMRLALALFHKAAGGDLAAIKEIRSLAEEGDGQGGLVVKFIDDLK